MSSVFVYSNKILFLLAFGRIHDVNQLDDASQENQHAEHDNHVREQIESGPGVSIDKPPFCNIFFLQKE